MGRQLARASSDFKVTSLQLASDIIRQSRMMAMKENRPTRLDGLFRDREMRTMEKRAP